MSLTIRNLTTFPLTCKLVERFPRPGPASDESTNLMSSCLALIATFFSWTFKKSAPVELLRDVEAPQQYEQLFTIEPFQRHVGELCPPEKDEIIRITFDVDGNRYTMNLPPVTERSLVLVPLDRPRHQFTAVYSPEHEHVAIFTSTNMNAWMKLIRDETPLTRLSIPGTHNSPTSYKALPSVRCQAVGPTDQMKNGVRFFDLRVQIERPADPTHDGLLLVHSVFSISLTKTNYFRDLVKDVTDFLNKNPSETMVVSLKREGTGNGTDVQLAHILKEHYTSDESRWYTKPHIPTLIEARGKIVVLRRFHIDNALQKENNGYGWCIDGSIWADNTPHALTPDNRLCVQDFYEVLETQSIDKKIQYASEQLQRAGAPTTLPVVMMDALPNIEACQPLYINFLSASNFWKANCWPEKIAARLNPAITDYLCRIHNVASDNERVGDGTTGIVVCDWVGNKGNWDLIRAIIAWNAQHEQRGFHP